MRQKLVLLTIMFFALELRILGLAENPPGFYADEASWAYNAYSMMQTGHDEYGRLLPWVFEAFGDYKLPVTVYSIVPAFWTFGVSDWSARLPTALYGVLSVMAVYFLVKELGNRNNAAEQKGIGTLLPELSALLLAIAPAHIFLSREIWDIQPALFFVTSGVIFFLKAVRALEQQLTQKRVTFWFSLAAVCFVLAMYAYNSARVVAPLLLVLFTILHWRTLWRALVRKQFWLFIVPIVLGVWLLWPQLRALGDPEVIQRARSVSIFSRGDVESKIFGATSADGSDQPLWLIRILHNKPAFYASEIAQRYIQHFSLNYLFLTGDTFEIFKVEGVGVLPLVMLPFLLLGMVGMFSERFSARWLLVGWLLIAPIPSALTVFTPSVSRAHNMIVPLVVITAYGILVLARKASLIQTRVISVPRVYWVGVGMVLVTNLAYWMGQYFVLTPEKVAHKWGSGWSELSKVLETKKIDFPQMILSNAQGPSYIWLAWYQRIDPQEVWSTRETDFQPDSNGLNNTYAMAGYRFTKQIKVDCELPELTTKSLCVGYAQELFHPTSRIMTANKLIAFEILEK